jgi:hypothetical protein
LVAPLFQVVGFYEYTAFIDGGITYALFYALPSLLLLLFLLPFYKKAITGHSGIPTLLKPFWLVFAIILVFHGPLSGPVLLIICPLTLLYCWLKSWKHSSEQSIVKRIIHSFFDINKELLISFIFIIIIALYSFYIGQFNIENIVNAIPLNERFEHLIKGLPIVFLEWSNGILPLILFILINTILLLFINDACSKRILQLLFLVFLFSIIYIFLTPFGGYREYRYYILRRDTIQPVLLTMYFAWGLSSIYILKKSNSFHSIYVLFLCIALFFYTFSDPLPVNTNACEREMLHQLSLSKNDCVELPKNCSVIGWGTYETCESSINAAELLKHWNITTKEIRYYYKP